MTIQTDINATKLYTLIDHIFNLERKHGGSILATTVLNKVDLTELQEFAQFAVDMARTGDRGNVTVQMDIEYWRNFNKTLKVVYEKAS